jgi:hypothetical protein
MQAHQYNQTIIVNSCHSSLKFQSDTLYDIVQYYIKTPSENIMNGMLSICHVQLYDTGKLTINIYITYNSRVDLSHRYPRVN